MWNCWVQAKMQREFSSLCREEVFKWTKLPDNFGFMNCSHNSKARYSCLLAHSTSTNKHTWGWIIYLASVACSQTASCLTELLPFTLLWFNQNLMVQGSFLPPSAFFSEPNWRHYPQQRPRYVVLHGRAVVFPRMDTHGDRMCSLKLSKSWRGSLGLDSQVCVGGLFGFVFKISLQIKTFKANLILLELKVLYWNQMHLSSKNWTCARLPWILLQTLS